MRVILSYDFLQVPRLNLFKRTHISEGVNFHLPGGMASLYHIGFACANTPYIPALNDEVLWHFSDNFTYKPYIFK